MHLKITKHGRFCKQKQPTPYQTHVELKDNSNVSNSVKALHVHWSQLYACKLRGTLIADIHTKVTLVSTTGFASQVSVQFSTVFNK